MLHMRPMLRSAVRTNSKENIMKELDALGNHAERQAVVETTRQQTAPYDLPDAKGHFGQYGGSFVSETLSHALAELKAAYAHYSKDPGFIAEFHNDLKHFVGRPSPIYHAKRWSDKMGGAQIYFKREDLNHTGAHKINNVIGQALLARRMGKPRIIAETGAGQHGVATATICARFGLECVVYMGSEDVKRQAQNVYRMKLLGATVVPVESGSKTLKDALNEAMRDWVTNVENTFYIIGTVAGPHPYPMMVRDFQSVIGQECLTQMPEMVSRQPDYVVACIGGGSNAMGIFYPYIDYGNVQLIGVEAAGEGLESGKHSASLTAGSPGVLHGNRTYLLQDANGQIIETHSVSAGLDYPGVGPEHAWLKDSARAQYVSVTDEEALQAFHDCCHLEGIIPALESSHALCYAAKLAATLPRDKVVLANLSGRGDKDMHTVAQRMGLQFD
jgi:tryptophan synthase beta chain